MLCVESDIIWHVSGSPCSTVVHRSRAIIANAIGQMNGVMAFRRTGAVLCGAVDHN
jgi:hypothetical protein